MASIPSLINLLLGRDSRPDDDQISPTGLPQFQRDELPPGVVDNPFAQFLPGVEPDVVGAQPERSFSTDSGLTVGVGPPVQTGDSGTVREQLVRAFQGQTDRKRQQKLSDESWKRVQEAASNPRFPLSREQYESVVQQHIQTFGAFANQPNPVQIYQANAEEDDPVLKKESYIERTRPKLAERFGESQADAMLDLVDIDENGKLDTGHIKSVILEDIKGQSKAQEKFITDRQTSTNELIDMVNAIAASPTPEAFAGYKALRRQHELRFGPLPGPSVPEQSIRTGFFGGESLEETPFDQSALLRQLVPDATTPPSAQQTPLVRDDSTVQTERRSDAVLISDSDDLDRVRDEASRTGVPIPVQFPDGEILWVDP